MPGRKFYAGGVTSTPQANSPLRVVVLVSGTGSLLQSIIDNQDEHYQVVKVVADVECQGITRAQAAGIDAEVVALEDKTPEGRSAWNHRLVAAVSAANPDAVVSAGFMRILGQEFLDTFEGRTINTHPALLPSFPGAHGVADALAYGVKVTGSTVHFVDAGVDTGRIIAQRPVLVEPTDTVDTLHERIKVVERELIVAVLRGTRVADGRLECNV